MIVSEVAVAKVLAGNAGLPVQRTAPGSVPDVTL